MQVRFKVNVGSRDAESYDLNFAECQRGMECEVSDEVGQLLVSNNFAEAVETKKTVRGVSPSPEISEGSPSTIKAEPATAKAKPVSHKES